MPDETNWKHKKRVVYPLAKLGYDGGKSNRRQQIDSDSDISSQDSYEERRGFSGLQYTTHWY